jgi:hypothetical protein
MWDYPVQEINDLSSQKGAIRKTTKNKYDVSIETIIVKLMDGIKQDHYAYIASPKGYFQIFGRGNCTEEVDEIFNLVLNNFEILK